MNWDELFSGKYFVSDLGEDQIVQNEAKEKIVLGRYAAWAPIPGGRNHQIVEISSDLSALLAKYHIPEDRVCTLA